MICSLLVVMLFSLLSSIFSLLLCTLIALRIVVQLRKTAAFPQASQRKTISFFHPKCLSGGGGERVLWIGVNAILKKFPNVDVLVHTAEKLCFEPGANALEKVSDRFGIEIEDSERVKFSSIERTAFLLNPSCYPVVTLLGQFLGGLLCSLEALVRAPTDLIVDTTGHAALIIPWKLFGQAKVVSYVHYPTISTSMLERVSNADNTTTYNNAQWIRESQIMTLAKVYYYKVFATVYGFFGSFCDCVMTNSTWTNIHIKNLWGGQPHIVYPPCDTEEFSGLFELEDKPGKWIISIGQFRPEKNHKMQLASFARFLRQQKSDLEACKLHLVGGCRDEGDYQRVEELKQFSDQLGITHSVEFHVNIAFGQLKQLMSKCTVNLHTMVEEHFGISVVEGMAAGLITVAHGSGGPLTDIIGPEKILLGTEEEDSQPHGVGFLCTTENEYAETFEHVFNRMSRQELEALRERAKDRACRLFSHEIFVHNWNDALEPVINSL